MAGGVPPSIEDSGRDGPCIEALICRAYPGAWLDAIAHSPCLNVSDYTGRRHPDGDGFTGPVAHPFHDNLNSQEEQDNHAA